MEIKTPKTAYEMELMHQFPPPMHRKITLANWLEGPPVRWSFMHACELVPSAEAHRGYRPRAELPRHEQELDAILFSGINQEDLTICDMLSRTYTDGFLVIHQGKIIKERKGKQGFGYDPVFVPHGYEQTFAEMDAALKNSISHRAKAVQKLVDFLLANA